MACLIPGTFKPEPGFQFIDGVKFPLPQVGSTAGDLTWEIPKIPVGLNPTWGRAELNLHKYRKTYHWIIRPLSWVQVEALFNWWKANRGKTIRMEDEWNQPILGKVVQNPKAKLIAWGNVPSCDNNASVWEVDFIYEADEAGDLAATPLSLPSAIPFEPNAIVDGQTVVQSTGQTVELNLKCRWLRTINADVVTMTYGVPTLKFMYSLQFQTKPEIDEFSDNIVANQGGAAIIIIDQYWGARSVIYGEMPVTVNWHSLNLKYVTITYEEVY